MSRSRDASVCWIVGAVVVGIAGVAGTEPAPTRSTPPPPDNTVSKRVDALPHIAIDTEYRHIDLDATIILREGGWLELLACTPQTRTHESILAVHARPRHIHLALTLLNVQAGAPMRWQSVDGEYQAQPAHGPQVAVDIVWQRDDGRPLTTPAHHWVINRKTGQTLSDNIWIFTGSGFDTSQNPPVYRADVEGSVLSLVHFGHEILARQTDQTNQTDSGSLGPFTERIPPVGTAVKIRLRPVDASSDPIDPGR